MTDIDSAVALVETRRSEYWAAGAAGGDDLVVSRRGLAEALVNLSNRYAESRNPQAAVASSKEGVDLYREALDLIVEVDTGLQLDFALALRIHAQNCADSDDSAEALAASGESAEVSRAVHVELNDSRAAEIPIHLAIYGRNLVAASEYSDATSVLSDALESAIALDPDNAARAGALGACIDSFLQLASVSRVFDSPPSVDVVRGFIALVTALIQLGSDQVIDIRPGILNGLFLLCAHLFDQKRSQDLVKLGTAAEHLFRDVPGGDTPDCQTPMCHIFRLHAVALIAEKEPEKALQCMSNAMVLLERDGVRSSLSEAQLMEFYDNYAVVLGEAGKSVSSILIGELAARDLRGAGNLSTDTRVHLARTLSNLSVSFREADLCEQAVAVATEAVEIYAEEAVNRVSSNEERSVAVENKRLAVLALNDSRGPAD